MGRRSQLRVKVSCSSLQQSFGSHAGHGECPSQGLRLPRSLGVPCEWIILPVHALLSASQALRRRVSPVTPSPPAEGVDTAPQADSRPPSQQKADDDVSDVSRASFNFQYQHPPVTYADLDKLQHYFHAMMAMQAQSYEQLLAAVAGPAAGHGTMRTPMSPTSSADVTVSVAPTVTDDVTVTSVAPLTRNQF